MARTGSILRRVDALAVPLPVIIRVFLGAYFIYAGVNKALDPIEFLKAIRTYGVLPETLPYFLNAAAIVLPWLEIICGAGLVLGLLRRGAGTLIALMLCVFTPAILIRALAMMDAKGLSFFAVEFDCGCGTGREIIWIKLLKNTALLLLALWTVWSPTRRWELAAWFDRPRKAAVAAPPHRVRRAEGRGDAGQDADDRSPVPVGASDTV